MSTQYCVSSLPPSTGFKLSGASIDLRECSDLRPLCGAQQLRPRRPRMPPSLASWAQHTCQAPSREAARTASLPAASAFAVVASRCAASCQVPSDCRCAASTQAPPRESANTAGPAVSKSESTATTIVLAVATPVGDHPKAPRRIALNAHAIASLLVHTRGLTFVFPSHEANDICQIVPTVHDAVASR